MDDCGDVALNRRCVKERRANEVVLGEAIDLDFSGIFLDPNSIPT